MSLKKVPDLLELNVLHEVLVKKKYGYVSPNTVARCDRTPAGWLEVNVYARGNGNPRTDFKRINVRPLAMFIISRGGTVQKFI